MLHYPWTYPLSYPCIPCWTESIMGLNILWLLHTLGPYLCWRTSCLCSSEITYWCFRWDVCGVRFIIHTTLSVLPIDELWINFRVKWVCTVLISLWAQNCLFLFEIDIFLICLCLLCIQFHGRTLGCCDEVIRIGREVHISVQIRTLLPYGLSSSSSLISTLHNPSLLSGLLKLSISLLLECLQVKLG